jgi:hypothetical protein
MLVEIPEDFEEDFMQLLIDQLHQKTQETYSVKHDMWDAEAKLKELEKILKENEERSKTNELHLKELERMLKKELKKKY